MEMYECLQCNFKTTVYTDVVSHINTCCDAQHDQCVSKEELLGHVLVQHEVFEYLNSNEFVKRSENGKRKAVRGWIYVLSNSTTFPDVVKVGRTEDLTCRIKQYPQGSIIHYSAYVLDMVSAERLMLKLLRGDKVVKNRRDYGSEYFEGDVQIITTIADHAAQKIGKL